MTATMWAAVTTVTDLTPQEGPLVRQDDPPLNVWDDTHCLTATTVASVARRIAVLETMYGALRHDPLYTVGNVIVHEPGTDTSKPPVLGSGLIGKDRSVRLDDVRRTLREGVYPLSGQSHVFPSEWLRPCDAWRIQPHHPHVLGAMWGWERDLKWATVCALAVNMRKCSAVSYMEPQPAEWEQWASSSPEKVKMLESLPPEEAREVQMFRTRLVWGWSTICALRGRYTATGPQIGQWTSGHNETLRRIWDTAQARARAPLLAHGVGTFPPKRTRRLWTPSVQVPDPVTPASCGDYFEDLNAAQMVVVQDDGSLYLTPSGLLTHMLAEGTYAAGAF